MSPQFDWQTDEEGDWEPEPPAPPPPEPSGRRRNWQLLLAALFLLTAALLILGRRTNLQVQQVEDDTREAVLAAHGLLVQAATEQDEELFAALMAGDGGWWEKTQLDLVAAGSLTDRQPLGLVQQEPVTGATVMELSPALDGAQVSFPVNFMVNRPDGRTETVTLQQNMTFIKEKGSWRYTRPDVLSWGAWQTLERDQVRVAYREVEGEIGARLAADLIVAINDMCLYTGSCPPKTEINIRFEETLNSLPQPARTIFPAGKRISIGLPTPALVGLPADEAAYQALRRGYARHVLDFLILRWEAPEFQAGMETYHDALLRRRFMDLGLDGWPNQEIPLPETPPYPLPAQNLATICVAEPGRGSQLLVYDLQAERWKLYLRNNLLTRLDPLPDDNGLLLHRLDQSIPDDSQLLLWRPGDPLIEMGRSIRLEIDRSGPGATLQIVDRGYGWSAFRLPDFTQCTAAECRMVSMSNTAVEWSPDGRFLIHSNPRNGRYSVRDGNNRSERILTTAISAHWADTDTVALVRWENSQLNSQRITLFEIPWGEQRNLVSVADLLAAIPESTRPTEETLHIYDVLAWPGRQDRYLVAAFHQDPRAPVFPVNSDVYFLAVQTGREPTIELLATINGQVRTPMEFSPAGRWLANSVIQPDTNTASLSLIDLESGLEETFHFAHKNAAVTFDHDWSADGNWLVIADNGTLTLIAPGSGYQRTIVPPVAGCAYSAFLNR